MARIPEKPEPLDARQQAIHDRIAAGPRGRVRGPLALWLHSPDLCERAQALGEYLRFNSIFPPVLSELIILMVGRHFDSAYEWAVHEPIALRAGLPAAVLRAIAERRRPDVFGDEDQRIVHDFVAEMLASNRVSDAAFAAFHARFGERGVVDATAIMGYYALGAYLLNAVELPLPTA